jgi:hypothetical protein
MVNFFFKRAPKLSKKKYRTKKRKSTKRRKRRNKKGGSLKHADIPNAHNISYNNNSLNYNDYANIIRLNTNNSTKVSIH